MPRFPPKTYQIYCPTGLEFSQERCNPCCLQVTLCWCLEHREPSFYVEGMRKECNLKQVKKDGYIALACMARLVRAKEQLCASYANHKRKQFSGICIC